MDAKDLKIAQLEEKLEELRFVNSELRAAIEPAGGLDGFPRLTKPQMKILMLLARHGRRTHAQLYSALFADRNDPPLDRIIYTHICHLRRRLRDAGLGVEIVGHFSEGYELAPASREFVLAAERAFIARQSRERAA